MRKKEGEWLSQNIGVLEERCRAIDCPLFLLHFPGHSGLVYICETILWLLFLQDSRSS